MADDLYTVADSLADALDLSGNEVSNLKEAAPLAARLPAVMASNGETHKYSRYTQSPVTGFRSENDGREHDHSVDDIITVTLKILDFSWKVDKAVADRWRQGGRSALIAREGLRHVQNALWKVEKQFIYGTGTGGDAAGFTGLMNSTDLDALADDMVVNAGGTTATTASSCYLLRTNESEVAMVTQGDGIVLGDTIIQETAGATGSFPAYYTPACTWVGLQLGGKYSAARICNLTEDSGKGLTDALIFSALKLFPSGMGPNLIVTNKRSQEQLRASRTATNVTGAPAPIPDSVAGIPLITTDAILETEALEV